MASANSGGEPQIPVGRRLRSRWSSLATLRRTNGCDDPWLLAIQAACGTLALAVAVWARWGADWPAQDFRAWAAAHDGLTLWTNWWYAGQPLPGYSVAYPLVAAVLGSAMTGVLAVAVGLLAAPRLAPPHRVRRRGFTAGVGIVLVGDLLIGQVPYLAGVCCAALAVIAVQAGQRRWAFACAVLASLFSPLAGVFLLLAIPALLVRHDRRRVVPLCGAIAGSLVSAVVGGASGPAPFTAALFGLTMLAAVALAVPRSWPTPARVFGVTYASAAALAFALPNPIGGNIARLSQLVVVGALWHFAPALRWRTLAAPLAALALIWSMSPAWSAAQAGQSDAARSPGYWAGLDRYLAAQYKVGTRVEVAFTRTHWEARWVAPVVPLARGWERQTDALTNAVLYHPLTAAVYRSWLDANAISWVVLPDVPLDSGGAPEAALLQHPPSFLALSWHDAHIRVWKVVDPQPLVSGAARLTDLDAASFQLEFAHPGTAVVRLRSSLLWQVASGEACLATAPGSWLSVTASTAGPVRVETRVTPALIGLGTRCS